MTLPEQYPTIESLPETPIRVPGNQHTQRLARLLWLVPVAGTAFLCAVPWFTFGHWPAGRHILVVFFFLIVFCAAMRLSLLTAAGLIEVSCDGSRHVRWPVLGTWLSWDDFRKQRVEFGDEAHSYLLRDEHDDYIGHMTLRNMDVETGHWLHTLISSVHVPPSSPAPVAAFTSTRRVTMGSAQGLTDFVPPLRTMVSLRQQLVDAHDEAIGGNFGSWNAIEAEWSENTVRWEDVLHVEVWQLQHGRPDFVTLQLTLRDDSGTDRALNWHVARYEREEDRIGSTRREILALVQEHVREDRITTFALHGPPKSLDEWQQRYERIVVPKQRVVRWSGRLLPVAVGMLIMGVAPGVPAAFHLLGFLIFILAGPVVGVLWYFGRKELAALEQLYGQWKLQLTETVQPG